MHADDSNNPTLSPEEFSVLVQVIRDVARYGRLSADDAQDFAQTVHLKMLERSYSAFRQFSGRSSLRTFLTVIVQRMLLDWRRARNGKWRVSAAARRLGSVAMALDTLLFRDGHSVDTAVGILQSRPDAPPSAEIRGLAAQLPVRHRRQMVDVQTLDTVANVHFEDPVERSERERASNQQRRRLVDAIKHLAPEDRRLLNMRYRQEQRVPAIARELHMDPKVIYRSCDKVLRSLRHSIQTA